MGHSWLRVILESDVMIFTAYPVAGYGSFMATRICYELNLNDDIIILIAYPVAGYGSLMAASRV